MEKCENSYKTEYFLAIFSSEYSLFNSLKITAMISNELSVMDGSFYIFKVNSDRKFHYYCLPKSYIGEMIPYITAKDGGNPTAN